MKKPFKKPSSSPDMGFQKKKIAMSKLSPGDLVEIKINDRVEKGKYLESHDRGVVLLKLDTGYNIGLKKEDISEIKVIERNDAKKKETKLKNSGDKPIIDFYMTGGTISSKLDPSTGGNTWLIDSNELFSTYPEVFDFADVRVKSPFMKASENMDSIDWIKLAKLIGKSLNDPQVKGVIVTHGTDFLHYTGAALSFMLGKLNKPVVLTYSQRSSDRGSSDSKMNLICSAHAALSDIAEVMLVGHATNNDDYCYALQGNKCRKMHTSRRDTFRPINCEPFAKIWSDGKIENVRDDFNKRNKSKVTVDAVFDSKIALVKFYPGQDPSIFEHYQKKGYKGIIVEVSGLGHLITAGKNNCLPVLKKVMDKGLLVYAAPQTLYGRLHPFVYSPGRKLDELGVGYLRDMLPETAFVKLGWVLGHKQWRGSVVTKKKMLESVSGEINDRLGDEFLN